MGNANGFSLCVSISLSLSLSAESYGTPSDPTLAKLTSIKSKDLSFHEALAYSVGHVVSHLKDDNLNISQILFEQQPKCQFNFNRVGQS